MSPSRLPACLLVALLVVACGGESSGPGNDAALAEDLLRERAAALYVEDKFAEALEVLTPLVERPDATLDDLLRATLATMDHLGADPDAAWTLAERMHAMAPDDPRVAFVRGQLLLNVRFEPELAAEAFRLALTRHSDDLRSHLFLGDCLLQMADMEGAAEQFRVVQAAGPEVGKELYVTAIYKLGQLLVRQGATEEGMALLDERTLLEESDAGLKGATEKQQARGPLSEFVTPALTAPDLSAASPAAPLGAFTEVTRAPLADAEQLLAGDVDNDGRTDLLAWGATGVALSLQQPGGSFGPPVASAGPGALVSATLADLDPDLAQGGTRELVTVERGSDGAHVVRLWAYGVEDGTWSPWGPGQLDIAEPLAAVPCDFDHDGDLDLAVPTSGTGLRLLRNDLEGHFEDATPAAAAALAGCLGVIPEDIDGDNDVDLLVTTQGGVAALSNERGGRFRDVTAEWATPQAQGAVNILDLDADGRADLVWTLDGVLHFSAFDGRAFAGSRSFGHAVAGSWFVADVNLDTYPDLVMALPAEGDLAVHLGPLGDRLAGAERLATVPAGTPVLAADILGVEPGPAEPGSDEPPAAGGDGRLELAVAGPDGVTLYRREAVNGFSLALVGVKDNDAGVGALVEVRSGERYQRTYWRGRRTALGLADAGVASFVRVTWPNGVVQHVFDVAAGASVRMRQVNRFAGSCPFLYTWNGERFVFVTDVLGTTPLGLPMSPDALVPFDHEEYVKVRGDQLVADADGSLRLAVTEELREVTYLDRVRLHVLDHPAGTEVQPDEAFSMPPFPPHHVHTLTEVLSPALALANRAADGPLGYGSRDRAGLPSGRTDATADDRVPLAHAATRERRGGAPEQDVTELLARVDEHHARPFLPLSHQFQGLTEPWSLDLHFGRDAAERAALAAAPRLRLALTGWFRWGDASVNMVTARHPDHEFLPPVLWVPDGDGWRPIGPPIGFPAGKTKTMIVDLTDVLDRADPRLRMTTTLELSWDAVRLVIDGDDAPVRETVLEASVADLDFRGFSTMLETGRDDWPELFDWHVLTGNVPWNQHLGFYTRYGDVLPLLGAVDDQYVLLGAGDAVELAFDGSALPALPDDWTRSYLVYFDGWAKDGDPNTLAAQHVLPLPFHGMTNYPPPAGESFPDTAEHRQWQGTWNTRPARRLIPSLVPGADDAALHAWESALEDD